MFGIIGIMVIISGSGDFFVLSETIAKIPFKQIGHLSLTLYGFYKMTITGYRSTKKLMRKFKEHRHNKLMKCRSTRLGRQANFLAVSIRNCPSLSRTFLIYNYVLNL